MDSRSKSEGILANTTRLQEVPVTPIGGNEMYRFVSLIPRLSGIVKGGPGRA